MQAQSMQSVQESTRQPSRPSQLAENDVFPVSLAKLRLDSTLRFDLYRQQQVGTRTTYVLYRHRDHVFSTQARRMLVSYGVETLYVAHQDRDAYEEQCESINNDETRIRTEAILLGKAKILHGDMSQASQQMFKRALNDEAVTEINESLNEVVGFLNTSPEAYGYLLSMKQQKHPLYLHSVNVSVLSIGLAKRVGVQNVEMLQYIATGALFHDLGLTKVPSQILGKEGPLSRKERLVVQQHPTQGFDMIQDLQGIHWIARKIVQQHHEKCDRSGYPYGLPNKEIHMFSRIVTLCEIYDALTNPRVYAQVLPPRKALELMIHEMKTELDKQLLVQFIQFVGTLRVPSKQAVALIEKTGRF